MQLTRAELARLAWLIDAVPGPRAMPGQPGSRGQPLSLAQLEAARRAALSARRG